MGRNDNVPKIDLDPEFQPLADRQAAVSSVLVLLQRQRTEQSIERADEDRQQPIAHGLDELTVMPADDRGDHIAVEAGHARGGAVLVAAHQPTVILRSPIITAASRRGFSEPC